MKSLRQILKSSSQTQMNAATAYSTMRPCFDCTKIMLQAKIKGIYYLHDWSHPLDQLQQQYELIQDKFENGVHAVDLIDDEAEWANNTK